MAEAKFYRGDGVVVCDAGDEFTFDRATYVTRIVLTGADDAAPFVLVIGEVPLTLYTTTEMLTLIVPIERAVKYVKLTTGPGSPEMYVFLAKK